MSDKKRTDWAEVGFATFIGCIGLSFLVLAIATAIWGDRL